MPGRGDQCQGDFAARRSSDPSKGAPAKERTVLLNRAPSLHRMSSQAFEPVLVKEKDILFHQLVCHAFNADFDGDQMGVHLQVGVDAQIESRILMRSCRNLFSPATGKLVEAFYAVKGERETAELLDLLKDAGFKHETLSGISICSADILCLAVCLGNSASVGIPCALCYGDIWNYC